MGHIVRAVSIARAIRKRLGIDPTIIASSAFSFLLKKKYFRFEIIEPGGDGDLYREKILNKLRELAPTLLVVDALPMGLMGELGRFFSAYRCRKALIARRLRRDYCRAGVIGQFVRANYDLVIKAEKIPDDEFIHSNAIEIPPVLPCSGNEILSRTEARRRLAVPKNKFLVMAISTLNPSDTDKFFEMTYDTLMKVGNREVAIKFASPYGDKSPSSAHTSYFPLMKLMRGVDMVVGHGGYHLIHETRALDVPFAAIPIKKLYDDQESRVAAYSSETLMPFKSAIELENIFKRFLGKRKIKRTKPRFVNGAIEAANEILTLSKLSQVDFN